MFKIFRYNTSQQQPKKVEQPLTTKQKLSGVVEVICKMERETMNAQIERLTEAEAEVMLRKVEEINRG